MKLQIVREWQPEVQNSFEWNSTFRYCALIRSRLFHDWFIPYTLPFSLSPHSYAIHFSSNETTKKSIKWINTEESYSIFILFVQITFVAWRNISIVLDKEFSEWQQWYENRFVCVCVCVKIQAYEWWGGRFEMRSYAEHVIAIVRTYCQRNHLMEITFQRKWSQDRQKHFASSDFHRYAMNASQIDRFHSQIWLKKKKLKFEERKKMFV